MTEKKATKKATASKKTAKKSVLHINAESVGFRAGDVYQTLAASQTALCVEDIAKKKPISHWKKLIWELDGYLKKVK